MPDGTARGGDYKLILSSVKPESVEAVGSQLAALLGLEPTGAQMIVKAAPIILLEGLTPQQAAAAGKNTVPLRQAGAELQVAKGPVGKLRKSTWPEATYAKILQRVTGVVRGGAADESAADEAEGGFGAALAEVSGPSDSAYDFSSTEAPTMEFNSSALREEEDFTETDQPTSSDGPEVGYFVCPHCKKKFELRPADGADEPRGVAATAPAAFRPAATPPLEPFPGTAVAPAAPVAVPPPPPPPPRAAPKAPPAPPIAPVAPPPPPPPPPVPAAPVPMAAPPPPPPVAPLAVPPPVPLAVPAAPPPPPPVVPRPPAPPPAPMAPPAAPRPPAPARAPMAPPAAPRPPAPPPAPMAPPPPAAPAVPRPPMPPPAPMVPPPAPPAPAPVPRPPAPPPVPAAPPSPPPSPAAVPRPPAPPPAPAPPGPPAPPPAPSASPGPPPAAAPAPSAGAPPKPGGGKFMVRIDCLVLKAGQKDEAAEAIAEIKSITPEQAHEEMDRAGRRRYILAKNLSQAEAREYAERFNAIHPKCAEFTKPRLG